MIINKKLKVLQMLKLLLFLIVNIRVDTNLSNVGVVWDNAVMISIIF
jgi:hypothetical protein